MISGVRNPGVGVGGGRQVQMFATSQNGHDIYYYLIGTVRFTLDGVICTHKRNQTHTHTHIYYNVYYSIYLIEKIESPSVGTLYNIIRI